jgi:hypothetical protein
MTDYTKSTNFASKDSLSPGSALKIVRGTEIDTEFNNIATAVATKADNSSAAITGGTINGAVIGGTTAAAGTFTTLSATGVTTVQAGTVSAPAITTSGDTNTGIFFPVADTIAFTEGGTEAMRIDASGNVGIGTSSPAAKLDVNGSLRLGDGNEIDFGGTTTFILGSSASSYLRFYTNNSERARIDSSGNLLINCTVKPSVGGAGSYGFATETGLSVSGVPTLTWRSNTTSASDSIYFYSSTSLAGYIRITGSSTSYVTSSDYRLKENIKPMNGALAKVAALKPCTYKWKVDGSDGQGFIAHELQAVVPDCVTGEKDAVDAEGNPRYQGIDTSFLVATLTAAIQELKAIVDTQAQRITALEATNT